MESGIHFRNTYGQIAIRRHGHPCGERRIRFPFLAVLLNQSLSISGRTFRSRLILGTGKFSSPQAMRDALEASGGEIVTVALRRADLSGRKDPFANILEFI